MNPRVALDLDGTLLDCRLRQVELAAVLLEREGLAPLDRDVFWALKRSGATTRDAFSGLGLDSQLVEPLARAWQQEIESPGWLAFDCPMVGVETALESLRKAGCRLSLLTARTNKKGVHDTLKRVGWDDCFEKITVVNPKFSAPEKVKVLNSWRSIAFIGDTESDQEAAKMSGTPFLALSWGQRDAVFLKSMGIDQCFPSISMVVDFLLGYGRKQLPELCLRSDLTDG